MANYFVKLYLHQQFESFVHLVLYAGFHTLKQVKENKKNLYYIKNKFLNGMIPKYHHI